MNKLLSYCFFKPLILPQNRTWDKDWDKHDRYYYNIPAVLLTNRILYPDYKTLIFVTPNIYENPLSRIPYENPLSHIPCKNPYRQSLMGMTYMYGLRPPIHINVLCPLRARRRLLNLAFLAKLKNKKYRSRR